MRHRAIDQVPPVILIHIPGFFRPGILLFDNGDELFYDTGDGRTGAATTFFRQY
jgi:hypothetical protein